MCLQIFKMFLWPADLRNSLFDVVDPLQEDGNVLFTQSESLDDCLLLNETIVGLINNSVESKICHATRK